MATGSTVDAVSLPRRARDVARGGIRGPLALCTALLALATSSSSSSYRIVGEADALLRGITAPAGGAWIFGADAYLATARGWLAHGEPARARLVLADALSAVTA